MAKHSNDRLQGTPDLMVLKSLHSQGAMHGYAIGAHITRISGSVLKLEEGSLYPALHRMTQAGWLSAEWGQSENRPPPPAPGWRRPGGSAPKGGNPRPAAAPATTRSPPPVGASSPSRRRSGP